MINSERKLYCRDIQLYIKNVLLIALKNYVRTSVQLLMINNSGDILQLTYIAIYRINSVPMCKSQVTEFVYMI